MRYERAEGRDRRVDNEPAARAPMAPDDELNREDSPDLDDNDQAATRRGSSSERSDR